MIDPLDFEKRPHLRKVSRKRFFAGLVIMLERLTLGLWQPFTFTLFFASLWLLQIPEVIGHIASIITHIGFTGGLLALFYINRRYYTWPDKHSINQRLERDSEVLHRPLNSLEDKLANPQKPTSRRLWDSRIERIFENIKALKFIKPSPLLAQQDRYGLRFITLLLFIAGLFVSGQGWDERIRYGLFPYNIHGEQARIQRGVNLWVTPPKYTKLPQIIVDAATEETLQIPQGSTLKVSVHGGWGKPTLYIGEQRWNFETAGDDSHIVEIELPDANDITIKQFFMPRASFKYDYILDQPPTIALSEDAPQVMPEGALRFPMIVKDDYGVKTLKMDMHLDAVVVEPPLGQAYTETRSVMSPAGLDFEHAPYYDLTAHYWAGLPALFTFQAEDHLGQAAKTQPLQMVIPERIFRHPVAKRLIVMRKDLIWNPDGPYVEMAEELEDILFQPHLYQDDIIAFLALRAASSRLFYTYEPSHEAARAIIDLLWDTALRIEDGNLSLAARDLRDAQNALEQALRNENVSDAEIAQLMHELREAMAEYFSELQKELQKRMAEMEAESEDMLTVPPDMLPQVIDPDTLGNFLDQLQQEMMSGDKNKAQDMLSQLQRMMDMMNPSLAMPMPKDMQMMEKGVSELQKLIEAQERLLSQTQQRITVWENLKTFQRSYGEALPFNEQILEDLGIEGLPPPPAPKLETETVPDINTQDAAQEQEGLRLILGQLMIEASEVLPDIPEGFGKAEREMFASKEDLGKNQPSESIPHQELAIKYLKEAQESLQQQFMARMKDMTGMAMGSTSPRRDPLGRPYGEDGSNGEALPGVRVEIPDERERSRALEILRELRRRSGEQSRPRGERDYYRRLLRQF